MSSKTSPTTARRTASTPAIALLSIASLVSFACGSSADATPKAALPGATTTPPSSTVAPPDTTEQGPTSGAVDHGAPSAKYPAFTPSMPQIVDNGGGVLASPIVVTVTFKGETSATELETFGDMIGASRYWKEVASEYGIGPTTSGPANHVRLKVTLPKSVSDADIGAFVAARIHDKSFPANKPGTIYTMYLPRGTAISDVFGDECPGDLSGTGGYHSSIPVDGANVVYAVMAQCTGSTLDDNTVTSSHEIGEASADPYVGDGGTMAWGGLNGPADFAWDYFMGYQDETADMCEFEPDQFDYEHDDLPFLVQRQWSNAAAKAGKSPCVPAPPDPFFDLALLAPTDALAGVFDDGEGTMVEMAIGGIHVDIGSSATVPLGFYSDRPTAPWQVTAKEMTLNDDGDVIDVAEADRCLTVKLDKESGQNGEKSYLTVGVTKDNAAKAHLLVLDSKLGDAVHHLPLFVGSTLAKATPARVAHLPKRALR